MAKLKPGRKIWPVLSALAIVGLQLFTGLRGIDYGEHWDEFKQILLVKHTVREGNIRHGWYHYPSVTYWLSLSALAPHVAGALAETGPDVREIQDHLRANVLDSPNYLLQIRKLFLFVSVLTTLWVFLAALVLGLRPWAAVLAAGLIGLSWEANYHARWIAPDAVLMQWSALVLLCAICYLRQPSRPLWGWLGAAVAGLAAGTKYQGGVLLAPILLVFIWNQRDRSRSGRLALVVGAGIVFATAYLASTPGTLLEPQAFLEDIRFELSHYRTGHQGRLVEPGIAHLARIGIYFFYVFFSHFEWAALLLSAPILWGCYRFWKASKLDFSILGLLPLGMALFFAAQRIMSPRNLLFIAPFLAILSAKGLDDLLERFENPRLRAGLAAGMVIVLAVNAGWLVHAGESIAKRSDERTLHAFLAYAAAHPGTEILVDAWIQEAAIETGRDLPGNLRANLDPEVDLVAIHYSAADRDEIDWPLALPKPSIEVFGPYDSNLDYYPGWLASDHIVVLPIQEARDWHVPLVSE